MSSQIVPESSNGATPLSETNSDLFAPGGPLDDPDRHAAAAETTTSKSWTLNDEELEMSLVAHACRETAVLSVAVEHLDPKFLTLNSHKRLLRLAYDYYEVQHEAPKPEFLLALLRQNLKEKEAKNPDVILQQAILALDYVDCASNGFWIDQIQLRQKRHIIAEAYKSYVHDLDAPKLFENLDEARSIGQSQTEGLLDLDEIENLPDIEFQIEYHFPVNGSVTVYGASNSGKSFFMLEMAFAMASGTDFLGKFVTRPGKVLYVLSEGKHGLKGRLKAWQDARGIKVPRENIMFSCTSHNLHDRAVVDRLIAQATQKLGKVDGIFIDTLTRNFGGKNTDSNQDMSGYVANMDYMRETTGAFVLNAHHTGWGDVKRERGAAALRDTADSSICITKVDGGFEVSCAKQKDLAPFKTYVVETVPHLTSQVCRYRGAKGEEGEDKLMSTLPVLAEEPTADNTITLRQLVEQTGLAETTVQDRLNTLTRSGKVCSTKFGRAKHYWLADGIIL